MALRNLTLLITALLMTTPALSAEPAPAKPQFVQNSMNVYRRFVPEKRAEMIAFYEKVLGLRPLQPIDVTPSFQMILFGVGSGQIKLATGLKEDREYALGGVNDGTGIRLITLYYPDEAALAARFTAAGYDAPKFKDRGDGTRAAVVLDPGDFPLQLVAAPGAPAETFQTVEVGINVTDLVKSRAFYRDFVGLRELPPVKDALIGVTKYPYRHGQTTINLWSAGKDLPADTGSAGIQYVVGNVDAVDARAKRQRITVEQPLGTLAGFSLRTVWLNDPDGVTNYFAQVGAPANAGAAAD